MLAKRFLTDPAFRARVSQTQDLQDELSSRKKENAFLHQRIARLEAELAEARARAPRVDLSSAPRLERASKVYRKLAAKYHPDQQPCNGRGDEGSQRIVAGVERRLSTRAGRPLPPCLYAWSK